MVVYDVSLFNNLSAFLKLGSIGAVQYGFTIIFSLLLSWNILDEKYSCLKVGAVVSVMIGLVMNAASDLPSFDIGEYLSQNLPHVNITAIYTGCIQN